MYDLGWFRGILGHLLIGTWLTTASIAVVASVVPIVAGLRKSLAEPLLSCLAVFIGFSWLLDSNLPRLYTRLEKFPPQDASNKAEPLLSKAIATFYRFTIRPSCLFSFSQADIQRLALHHLALGDLGNLFLWPITLWNYRAIDITVPGTWGSLHLSIFYADYVKAGPMWVLSNPCWRENHTGYMSGLYQQYVAMNSF